MHAHPALYPLATATTVDPILGREPGTHHYWVDKCSVGSKCAQNFAHMTGFAGIEPQTPKSRVQRINRSATRSTHCISSIMLLRCELIYMYYAYIVIINEMISVLGHQDSAL